MSSELCTEMATNFYTNYMYIINRANVQVGVKSYTYTKETAYIK